MHSIIDIASEILRLSKAKNIALTPMHLMKLVYIAFGWRIALTEKRLFPQRIEAWRYGPVMPDLYHATKKWGKKEIPLELISDEAVISDDPDTLEFLENIVEIYKDYNGIGLSNLTHESGTPWDLTYEPNVFNKEIPQLIIQEHYKSRLDQ